MASAAFEEIADDFAFLDDWEDRYEMVIDMGKALTPMDAALKQPATKVEGCASQVWLHPRIEDGKLYFLGDSDALIVKGLIAVLAKLYNGEALSAIGQIDAAAQLARLGLNDHLSAQRSNGLRAMVERIQSYATQ